MKECKLAGIIPPLATPILDADELDVTGTVRLLEHVIEGGVHGVFILGTTGEGTSLPSRLRIQFVELVAETIASRVPLLVGVTDTCMSAAIELAEHSYAAGAAAVVTAAPYYLPMTQEDLQGYSEALASRLPLPLMLYNMPSCTKTAFAFETVKRLADHHNIVGLKDTSGDLDYYARVASFAKARDDFSLLIGPEEKLARSLKVGGHGGVCGGANLFPHLYVQLYHAATSGDWSRVSELQAVIQEVSDSLYAVTDSGARVIQGIKCGLGSMGLCSPCVAPPFRTYVGPDEERIRDAIQRLVPRIESECGVSLCLSKPKF